MKTILSLTIVTLALALSASLHAATAGPGPESLAFDPPLLAQTPKSSAVGEFINAMLAPVLLLIGMVVIAYGGYLTTRRRVQEERIAIIGGFFIAIAVLVMKGLMKAAGITF